tara:strand:+ start:59 stop:301 length:243 start_codon:yes stop_codon:yes gene_type:complete
MEKLLLIIGLSCFVPLVLNSVPYKRLIDKLSLTESYILTCCLCLGFYVGMFEVWLYDLPLYYIALIPIISELIDRRLNEH